MESTLYNINNLTLYRLESILSDNNNCVVERDSIENHQPCNQMSNVEKLQRKPNLYNQ